MNYEFPSQCGDLIFFSPPVIKSANIFAQSLLRWRKAQHSHIAIVAKQGNAIHAMPKQGVQVESIRQLLKDRCGEIVVYRNIYLSENVNIVSLENNLWSYNFQKYNYRFFLKSRRNASFCSELASRSYASIGMNISNREPNKTLPFDIYSHIKSNSDWENVTELYKDFFLTNDYPEVLEIASRFVRKLEVSNQLMTYPQYLLKFKIESISETNGSLPPQIDIPRSYWTDPTEPSTFTVILYILRKIFFDRKY